MWFKISPFNKRLSFCFNGSMQGSNSTLTIFHKKNMSLNIIIFNIFWLCLDHPILFILLIKHFNLKSPRPGGQPSMHDHWGFHLAIKNQPPEAAHQKIFKLPLLRTVLLNSVLTTLETSLLEIATLSSFVNAVARSSRISATSSSF